MTTLAPVQAVTLVQPDEKPAILPQDAVTGQVPATPPGFDIKAIEEKLKAEAKAAGKTDVSFSRLMLELVQQPEVSQLLAEKGVDVEAFQRASKAEAELDASETHLIATQNPDAVYMPMNFEEAKRAMVVNSAYNQQEPTALGMFEEIMKMQEDTFFGRSTESMKAAGITLERIFPEAHAAVVAEREETLAQQNKGIEAAVERGVAKGIEAVAAMMASQQQAATAASANPQQASGASFAERVGSPAGRTTGAVPLP